LTPGGSGRRRAEHQPEGVGRIEILWGMDVPPSPKPHPLVGVAVQERCPEQDAQPARNSIQPSTGTGGRQPVPAWLTSGRNLPTSRRQDLPGVEPGDSTRRCPMGPDCPSRNDDPSAPRRQAPPARRPSSTRLRRSSPVAAFDDNGRGPKPERGRRLARRFGPTLRDIHSATSTSTTERSSTARVPCYESNSVHCLNEPQLETLPERICVTAPLIGWLRNLSNAPSWLKRPPHLNEMRRLSVCLLFSSSHQGAGP
jgi:hypothetical protein